MAEFKATRGPSLHVPASPYPVGMRNGESRTSTDTSRFVGRHGMMPAANNPTVMPEFCDPSIIEGTRSALATEIGEGRRHQKKSVRISSHSPIFIRRATSPDMMRSRHSFPYPSYSSKTQGGTATVNPAGHYSSPAAVEYDRIYSTTIMTNSSRPSRSNRNR